MAGFRQDPIQLINLIADNLRDRYPDSFSILKAHRAGGQCARLPPCVRSGCGWF